MRQVAALLLALTPVICAAAPAASAPPEEKLMPVALGAFAHVTVGVADLEAILPLWRDTFGLEVVATRTGADASVERLWELPPGSIRRQALLRTPRIGHAGLHFVEFTNPGVPVRRDAEVFDRVPKNLDLYVRDLPEKYDRLVKEGFRFRARWAEMPGPEGLVFREVQLPGHDATNIVLLEILDTDYVYSPQGFAAVGPLVVVVVDAETETAFYRDVLGLDYVIGDLLAGPEIERMVGLPPGAGLDYRVFGEVDDPMGRIEIIEYQQTAGRDLYARAVPPALGTLHVTWRTTDLGPLRASLADAGIEWQEHGDVDALFGRGPMVSFSSPGGLRIEVQQGR